MGYKIKKSIIVNVQGTQRIDYYLVELEDITGRKVYNCVRFIRISGKAAEEQMNDTNEDAMKSILKGIDFPLTFFVANEHEEGRSIIGYATSAHSEHKSEAEKQSKERLEVIKREIKNRYVADIHDLYDCDRWFFEYIKDIMKYNISVFYGQPSNKSDEKASGTTKYVSVKNQNGTSSMYKTFAEIDGVYISSSFPITEEELLSKERAKMSDNVNIFQKNSEVSKSDSVGLAVPIMGSMGISGAESTGDSTSQMKSGGKTVSKGTTDQLQYTFGASDQMGVSGTQSQGTQSGIKSPLSSYGLNTTTAEGINSGQGMTAALGGGSGTTKSTSISNMIAEGFGKMHSMMSAMAQGISTGLVASFGKSYTKKLTNNEYRQIAEDSLMIANRVNDMRKIGAHHNFMAVITKDSLAKKTAETAVVSAFSNTLATEKFRAAELSREEELVAKTAVNSCMMPVLDINSRYTIENNQLTTILSSDEDVTKCLPEVSFTDYVHAKKIPPPEVFRIPMQCEKNGKIRNFLATVLKPETLNKTTVLADIPILFHTLITGSSGTGKTTFAIRYAMRLYEKFGINVIAVNNKRSINDWTVLKKYYPDAVQIYSLGLENRFTLYCNPMYIPENKCAEEWAESLSQSLCKTMGNQERTLFRIKEAILAVYREHGVISGTRTNRECSKETKLTDVLDYIKKDYAKQQAMGRMDFNTQSNFTSIIEKLTAMFGSDTSMLRRIYCPEVGVAKDLAQALFSNKIIVLDTEGLEGSNRKFIVDYISKYLFLTVEGTRRFINNPFMFMIEEANIMFSASAEGDNRSAGVISHDMWEDIAVTARAYGMFFSVITQTPSTLPKYLISECGVFISFKLQMPEDRQLITQAMGYDPIHKDIQLADFFADEERGMSVMKFAMNTHIADSRLILTKTEPLELTAFFMDTLAKEY